MAETKHTNQQRPQQDFAKTNSQGRTSDVTGSQAGKQQTQTPMQDKGLKSPSAKGEHAEGQNSYQSPKRDGKI